MNKKAILLIICGLIFTICPFIYNVYTIFRLISLLIGIIFLSLGFTYQKKNKPLKFSILIIFIFIIIFGLDTCLVRYFNRIPILSSKIKSSNKVATYNSFFYRVYDCNGSLIYDPFYQKKYACDIILPEENVNSLLSHIVNNFRDYKNKFINVNGKISNISGSSSIGMQIFEIAENSINGQVKFSENITLTIINNGQLKNTEDLKIYDSINIIGRIAKIKNKGQNKEIIMKDARIINRNNYQNYDISIINNKSCETDLKLLSKTEDYTYYNNCLDSIYVKYDNENIYDLGYVLTDKRMTFDLLIRDTTKEENNNLELYQFDEFNLIKCKNSNNIIGNKNLNLESNFCEQFTEYEAETEPGGIE